MKVLVPLPFDVSNLAHGRNLRVVHLLRELSGRCELACVTLDARMAEAARSVLPDVLVAAADIRRVGRADGDGRARVGIRGSYRTRRALGFLGYDQPLLTEITRRAPEADVVLGFDLPSVVYLRAAGGLGARTVCDLIDDPRLLRQSFPLARRWSPTGIKAAISIHVIRRRVLGTFDALTAVAPRDAACLSRATGVEVTVVPNGVEVGQSPPVPVERELLAVFTGVMDFPPNEAAACYLVRQVWPRVLHRFHDLAARPQRDFPGSAVESGPRLAIVGANPTPKVRRLAGRAGVVVTGRVEDVSRWLRRARVAVAPMMSGCGVKNKILEASAAGCPVVSTPRGAAGLPTGAARGIIVADTPQRIAEEVATLLTDAAAAQAIGAAGLAMVGQQFSWSQSAQTLLEVLAGEGEARSSTIGGGGQNKWELPGPDLAPGRQPRDDEEALIHAAS